MPDVTTHLPNMPGIDVPGRIDVGLQEAASRLGEVLKTPKAPRNPPTVTPAEQALVSELAAADSISDAMDLPKAEDGGLDLITLITLLRNKVDENHMGFTAENVKRLQEQQAKAAEERIEKAREARLAAAEAEHSGVWGKILSWGGAGLMILIGAAMTVAGGAGTALIAVGIAMMCVQALQESGASAAMLNELASAFPGVDEETAHGIATGIVGAAALAVAAVSTVVAGPVGAVSVACALEAIIVTPENIQSMGASANDAGIASLVSSVTLALASMGTGIAAGVKGCGGAAAIGKAISKNVPATVQMVCSQVAKAGCMVQLGAQGANIYTGWRVSSYNSESLLAQADSKEYEAELTKTEHVLDEEAERIKEISRSITERVDFLMDILNQAYASHRRTLAV